MMRTLKIAVSIAVLFLVIDTAYPQKTLKEYCLEYQETSPLWEAILNDDMGLQQKLIVMLYDMYSKTTVRCQECIPWIFVVFSFLLIAFLGGVAIIILREGKQIIRYITMRNMHKRIDEIVKLKEKK